MVKIGKQPISFRHVDKIEHLIAYAVLTLIWLLALKNKVKISIIIICCIIYGVTIEFLQGLTSYRTFEFYDITANTLGILIALLIRRILMFLYWA